MTISLCSGPFVLRVAGLEDGGAVGPHSASFSVEQAPQAPVQPVVTARMADSITYTVGYSCVLASGTALAASDFEYRILVRTCGVRAARTHALSTHDTHVGGDTQVTHTSVTDEPAYTGPNTTMAVAVPPAPAGSATGTAVDATVRCRSPLVQANAFSAASAAVATNARLVEPDAPPEPTLAARKPYQLEASGTPAE